MKTPSYAASFQCIGSKCEDTCCAGWDIPVEQATYSIYKNSPADRLGSLVSRYVAISPAGSHENLYARITATSSGRCPFHTADRLCGIQQEYGPTLLPATCSIYPRVLNRVAGALEGSLLISCPEAARQVLLDPAFFEVEANLLSGAFRIDNTFHLYENCTGLPYKPVAGFHVIRDCLIALITDRSRPLWKRLLIVGALCEELSGIRAAEDLGAVPEIVATYSRPNAIALVEKELDKLLADASLRLSMIFRLTDMRLRDPKCGPRFVETYWSFIEGIGSPPGAPPHDDIRRFREAESAYYQPFFERFPFILENFLINSIVRTLFPFGQSGSLSFSAHSIFEEYVILATHFAWVTGLLVGVAGSYKESFANEQVIYAMQSHAREVDHSKATIDRMLEIVRDAGLDNLQGMAILLRP